MMTLLRDGFTRDLVILMIVSILVGTLLSTGIARAVDTYFGGTINGLIGDYGEYDLILHIREDAKDAAMKELKTLIANRLPGTKIKEGLAIAGKVNIFVSLPEELETKEILENLRGLFGDIPGQSGYTLMIEPAVVIRGTHAAVRDRLVEEIEKVPGVEFVFRDQGSLYALLNSVEHSKDATEAVNRILDQYQVLEVRFPMGQGVEDVASAGAVMKAALQEKFRPNLIEDITLAQDNENSQAFLATLSEMKRFLESYATKVTIPIEGVEPLAVGDRVVVAQNDSPVAVGEPVGEGYVIVEVTSIADGQARGLIVQGDISDVDAAAVKTGYKVESDKVGPVIGSVHLENERYQLMQAVEESIRLLTQLDDLSGTADAAVASAQQTLEVFQQSLVQLDELKGQIEQLNQTLNGGPNASPGNMVLSLLIKQVMQSLVGESVGSESDTAGSLQDLDVEKMKADLSTLAEQLNNIQAVDVQMIINQVEQVKASLPNLRDDEIGQSIKLINSYIDGQVIPGEQVQLLVDKHGVTAEQAEPLLREAVGNRYLSVYSSPVGIVNPNARAELFRVLKEVRATIAGLLAIVITVLLLILDYSTVLSVMKQLAARTKGTAVWKRVFDPVKLAGAFFGGILLVCIYSASSAEIPYVNPGHMALLGAFLGVAAALLCEKFSPVNVDEMMAGEALGLTYVQIMRNIVIPESRPGLLNLLNRWKQTF